MNTFYIHPPSELRDYPNEGRCEICKKRLIIYKYYKIDYFPPEQEQSYVRTRFACSEACVNMYILGNM